MKNRTILEGDVFAKLKEIDAESIDCIITSPPYWGLRDYGVEGQLGLEPDFRDYLKKMNDIMEECKRVLKATGTAWVNLGDTYQSSGGASDIKPKSLVGIPQRFMIDCIDSGWICRNDIIWHKLNAMPSSVKDRFTNKYEAVYFFSKNPKYFFDLNSVREPAAPADRKPKKTQKFLHQSRLFVGGARTKEDVAAESGYDPEGICPHCGKSYKSHVSLNRGKTSHRNYPDIAVCSGGKKMGSKYITAQEYDQGGLNFRKQALRDEGMLDTVLNNPAGKNPGDVFLINHKGYAGAHFATFPEELPTRILRAACPKNVCKKCGEPRHPISKPSPAYQAFLGKGWNDQSGDMTMGTSQPSDKPNLTAEYYNAGWTDCGCNAGWQPGIVLDPFFGAGTVAVAAEKLGLQWCGIELNPEYAKMARGRLGKYQNGRIDGE